MASDSSGQGFSLERLLKQVEGQSFPPVDKWNPDFCGDIDMEIRADGTWYYMGTPITRERMVRLFSTVLRHDEDGKFYLVTPVEKIGIRVEDAPFLAISVEQVGNGDKRVLAFTTNTGDTVIAGPENPVTVSVDQVTGQPRPYIRVRGRLDALIARPVYYELVGMASEQDGRAVVMSGDYVVDLGDTGEGG